MKNPNVNYLQFEASLFLKNVGNSLAYNNFFMKDCEPIYILNGNFIR